MSSLMSSREHAPPVHEQQPALFTLLLHPPDGPGRSEVECYISQIYRQRYGARVRHFAPTLVTLQRHGETVAAAGYRRAAQAPLFLERYLHAPIETLLPTLGGQAVPRAGIIEVGHLASHRAGEGRRLIHLLAPHLAQAGAQWVTSTVTRELRHLFMRTGVAPLTLAVAQPGALGPHAADWGSYYQHDPVVLAGHLPQALRHLARQHQPLGGAA